MRIEQTQGRTQAFGAFAVVLLCDPHRPEAAPHRRIIQRPRAEPADLVADAQTQCRLSCQQRAEDVRSGGTEHHRLLFPARMRVNEHHPELMPRLEQRPEQTGQSVLEQLIDTGILVTDYRCTHLAPPAWQAIVLA